MKILAVSAHCADFCSRSGGTLAKHVRKGDEVKVLALTHGERSESGGLYAGGAKPSLQEVIAVRHAEALKAAEILGVEIDFVGWGDLSFEFSIERAKRLAQEIRAFRPDVLITHHGPDQVSMDHDTTWRLVTRAVQMASAPGLESQLEPVRRGKVFLFEATVPLTELEGFNPDIYVDITDVWPIKLEALRAYARGQGFLEPWYTDVARRRAFQAQRLGGGPKVEYAEAFESTRPWFGDYSPI